MMRLLFLVQNYPPEGGSVRYIYNLAVSSAADGHRVSVITGLPHYPDGRPHPEFGCIKPSVSIEEGVKVIRTPLIMGSNRQLLRRLLGFITFIGSAIPWGLREPGPDVIIASVPPATVSLIGLIVSFLRRTPLVLILRDLEPVSSLSLRGKNGSLWGKLLIKFFMHTYRRADRIVVINKNQIQILRHYGINDDIVECIPHGVDTHRFHNPPDSSAKLLLDGENGHAKALYIGTIGACHDMETFLTLLADKRIRALPIQFIIIGDGERRKECERLIRDLRLNRVTVRPPVSPGEVPAVLAQADLLISSYLDYAHIGLGSKVFEYCAAGKPILIHGPRSSWELIHTIGNGWGCPNGDADGLFRAISQFLRSKDESPSRGVLGYDYALRHFDISHRYSQWSALLKSLINR
jgi:glycosyltransferase involved in cell wall biosynthesis